MILAIVIMQVATATNQEVGLDSRYGYNRKLERGMYHGQAAACVVVSLILFVLMAPLATAKTYLPILLRNNGQITVTPTTTATASPTSTVTPTVGLELLDVAASSGEGPPTWPSFTDIAPAIGLAYVPTSREPYGPSLVDYDGDGLLDILLPNHGSPPALLRQMTDGTLVDVASTAGLLARGDVHGVAWADYDNDGLADLYETVGAAVGTGQGANRLYQGLTGGILAERAAVAGVTDSLGRGRTASWADVNNNGYLDLYVTNASRPGAGDKLFLNQGDGTFIDWSAMAGDLTAEAHDGGVAWADYDNDGDMDVFVGGRAVSGLYRNDGHGFFRKVNQEAGIAAESFSAVPVWGDFDNDGWQDLFVTGHYYTIVDSLITSDQMITATFVTDWPQPDQDGLDVQTAATGLRFWVRFPNYTQPDRVRMMIRVGPDAVSPQCETGPGCQFEVAPGSIGAPEYDVACDHGLYIWEAEPGHWRVRWIAADISTPIECFLVIYADAPIVSVERYAYDPPRRGILNRLYRNRGDGTFEEMAWRAGVQRSLNSADATWVDVNLDGWLDLYVVHAGDTNLGNVPNALYLNLGTGAFRDVAALAGASGSDRGLGSHVAAGDFNGDGAPDLLILNSQHYYEWNGPRQLLINSGVATHHWLQIELVGQESNRWGVGARIEITNTCGLYQMREMNGGIHGSTQDQPLLIFGLGPCSGAVECKVSWPSGIVQRLGPIAPDQRITVQELDALTVTPTPTPTIVATATPAARWLLPLLLRP